MKLADSIAKLARMLLTAAGRRTLDRRGCSASLPLSNVTLLVAAPSSAVDAKAASPAAASVCGLTTESRLLSLSATSTTESTTHSAVNITQCIDVPSVL